MIIDTVKLRELYRRPRMKDRMGIILFYFDPIDRRYPRVRFRLDYSPATRSFGLSALVRPVPRGRDERRNIHDEDVVQAFRSSLKPEQIAKITRLSLAQVRGT